jgi:hypothetical protein
MDTSWPNRGDFWRERRVMITGGQGFLIGDTDS